MIELPEGANIQSATPRLVDFGGEQRPMLGGAVTRVNRPGARFAIEVGLAPMVNANVGRVAVRRLVAARREGLRIEWPLAGVDQGAPGADVTAQAGSIGTTLLIAGVTPGWAAREGYWLSVHANGHWCLHQVAATAVAGSDGTLTLTVEPPLRQPVVAGDAVRLAVPVIEGLVTGDAPSWEISLAHHVGIGFVLEEAA